MDALASRIGCTNMKTLRVLVLAAWTLFAGLVTALAQTERIGPGGIPMAPGPSQPRDFTPGGIGPGGVPVAPGSAARDVMIERIGPGGVPIAPGPAGNVGTGPTLPNLSVPPSSRDLSTTIRAKRRTIYRGKPRRSRSSQRGM